MLAHVVVSGTTYEYDLAIWPDTIRETVNRHETENPFVNRSGW